MCFKVLLLVAFVITIIGLSQASPSTRATSCNCACGVRGRRTQKIVGGFEAQPNEYPWIAGLFKQSKLYCGAAVLSNRFLLTAAHCVSSFEPNEIRAFVGGHNISRDYSEIKRIKRIIAHKDFDIFNFNNDIALLEMETPIFYGPRVSPVCLPSGEQDDFTDQLTVVSGWGRLSERSPTSQTLRSVVVPIWSEEECMMAGYGASRITSNMMCAGMQQGGIDACQGDSGGPMVTEGPSGSMEVIGIVSWGRGCARKSLPGIYTKVVNYLDWIHEHIEGECLCQANEDGQRTNFLEKLMKRNEV